MYTVLFSSTESCSKFTVPGLSGKPCNHDARPLIHAPLRLHVPWHLVLASGSHWLPQSIIPQRGQPNSENPVHLRAPAAHGRGERSHHLHIAESRPCRYRGSSGNHNGLVWAGLVADQDVHVEERRERSGAEFVSGGGG